VLVQGHFCVEAAETATFDDIETTRKFVPSRQTSEGGTTMSFKTRLVVGMFGAVSSLIVGSGVASAAPDVNAIVNSTCTYPQVMAALNAQSPDAARKISSNPMASAWLQQLVASPPDQRRQMIAQYQNFPAVQQYSGVISGVTGTCNNY
jgi:hemophore-related protein